MSSFTEYLPEVFENFGPVTLKSMFGGLGVFHEGVMFALVAADVLYLKTDSGNIEHFEKQGLLPFEYTGKDGRTVRMSYSRAPDALLDDRKMAAVWARRSYEAATRQHTKSTKPKVNLATLSTSIKRY